MSKLNGEDFKKRVSSTLTDEQAAQIQAAIEAIIAKRKRAWIVGSLSGKPIFTKADFAKTEFHGR